MSPVFSMEEGKVIDIGTVSKGNSKGTNYVILLGTRTNTIYGYFHVSQSPLQVGDTVIPGQMVGRIDLSGRARGAHLH